MGGERQKPGGEIEVFGARLVDGVREKQVEVRKMHLHGKMRQREPGGEISLSG